MEAVRPKTKHKKRRREQKVASKSSKEESERENVESVDEATEEAEVGVAISLNASKSGEDDTEERNEERSEIDKEELVKGSSHEASPDTEEIPSAENVEIEAEFSHAGSGEAFESVKGPEESAVMMEKDGEEGDERIQSADEDNFQSAGEEVFQSVEDERNPSTEAGGIQSAEETETQSEWREEAAIQSEWREETVVQSGLWEETAIQSEWREEIQSGLREETAIQSDVQTREASVQKDREPFSEEVLAMYYENAELDMNEAFIDEFLKNCSQERFEFYEVVMEYYKAKVSLEDTQKELKGLMNDYSRLKEKLWATKELSISAKGKCADSRTVTHTHNYKQALFDANKALTLDKVLMEIREMLQKNIGMKSYLCQLAKVHVDMYIHEMLTNLPYIKDVQPDSPITAWPNHSITSSVSARIDQLRHSVSVLFAFERKLLSNREFHDHLRHWIDQLLSFLLRVATLRDHLFILNHILRCPPGVGDWASKYVQLLSPTIVSIHNQPFKVLCGNSYPGNLDSRVLFQLVPPMKELSPSGNESASYSWGGPLLDHLLTMLVTLLLPVKQRREILAELEVSITPQPNGGANLSWTFVDEDGEEDEEPAESYWWLKESDLISLFNQFPITSLFQYILGIESLKPGSIYSVEGTTSFRLMRLFAFSTRLMKLLSVAFTSLQQTRYKRFVQLIGRTMRQTVHFMADHWMSYYGWRTGVLGETEDQMPDCTGYGYEPQFTLTKLRTEFDALFLRAIKWIQSAHRLGAWQFLADMPYGSISQEKVWEIFWFLVDRNATTVSDSNTNWKKRLQDPHRREAFSDYLMGTNLSETVFLLTTLANIATARKPEEREIAEAVALEIYEVSQLQPVTREICGKTGRDLLGSISLKHPHLISFLLSQVRQTIDQVGKACVYLFKALPVSSWTPGPTDFLVFRQFLLTHSSSSPQHQLARSIIADLNWGVTGEDGSGDLALPVVLHLDIAVLLVEVETYVLNEASAQQSSVGADILARLNLYHAGTDMHQDVRNWLWNVALSLCLHKSDHPPPVLRLDSAEQTSDQSTLTPDLHTDPGMLPVKQSVKDSSLACFIALSSTLIGHNIGTFCSEGLPLLVRLVESKHLLAALKVISNVLLMFTHTTDQLLHEPKFVSVIHSLALADLNMSTFLEKLTGKTGAGANTKLLASLVQTQIKSAQRPGSVQTPKRLVEFWTRAFTGIENWHKEKSIVCVLDSLIKAVFKLPECRQVVIDVIYEKYDEFLGSDKSKPGFLGSLFSLAGGGGPLSFLDHAETDYGWFSFVILTVERTFESQHGLIDFVDEQLQKNEKTTPDQALKTFFSRNSYPRGPFPSSRMTIHRWAERARLTPDEHPILPFLWAGFFVPFFYRRKDEYGAPCTTSHGRRFFSSHSSTSVLRSMKSKFVSLAEKHKAVALNKRDSERDEPNEAAVIRFHEYLGRFYYGMSYWLEEPYLHSPSLHLPDLPDQYFPRKLNDILTRNSAVWLDVIDWFTVNAQVEKEILDWIKATKLQSSQGRIGTFSSGMTSGPATANSRIMSRLRVPLSSVPPPTISLPSQSVEPVDFQQLSNKSTVISTLYRDLATLTDFAKISSERILTCAALDLEYLEALPEMYFNEENQVDICVPCRGVFNSERACLGPARMILKFREKRARSHVIRRVESNRSRYVGLLHKIGSGVDSVVPNSAVRVETAITLLARAVASNRHVKESALEAASLLFYHIVNLVDDSVRENPAMRQFFSFCIDVLGQEFIAPYPEQTKTLLYTMLESPKLAPMLGPIFMPTEAPDDFIQMYEKIAETFLSNPDLSFSLLTKFDINQWLNSSHPPLSQRQSLVSCVGKALAACGLTPSLDVGPVFEVLRAHLRHLLCFLFPSLYSDVLKLLFTYTGKSQISPSCWHDFLSLIGCPLDQPSKTVILQLSPGEVIETVEWLASYFSDFRTASSPPPPLPVAPPSLLQPSCIYISLRPYVVLLGHFLSYMGQLQIAYTAGGEDQSHSAVRSCWDYIVKLFDPWIHMKSIKQNDGTMNMQPPWVDTESVTASDMLGHFISCVDCIQSKFPNVSFSPEDAMSLLWQHYTNFFALPRTPADVLFVYHTRLLDLPWNLFFPTESVLADMIELGSLCNEMKFFFLSKLLPQMDWDAIIDKYLTQLAASDPNAPGNMLCSFLHLLVMMLSNKRIMDVENCPVLALVKAAHSFPWSYLSASAFLRLAKWQEEHCNPLMALEEKSCIRIALKLLRSAAGFSSSASVVDSETTEKRSVLVRLEVSLIIKCTSRIDVSFDSYIVAIRDLYRTIEAAAISDARLATQDIVILLSEFLNLLNNCSPNSAAAQTIRDTVLQSIASPSPASSRPVLTLPTLSSACRSLACMSHMTSVLEAALATHFKFMQAMPASQMSWLWSEVLGLVEIPELSVDDFVTSCVENRALLTLYAHALKQLPLCSSLVEEFGIFSRIVRWCSHVQMTPDGETKVILLWYKAIDLSLRQVDFGAVASEVASVLNQLAQSMTKLGEDKDSSGFFGKFGLGKKSLLSTKFRLVSRALAAALLLQLPPDLSLRLQPGDPGHPGASSSAASTDKAYHNFESLITNRNYQEYQAVVKEVCNSLANAEFTLRNVPELISWLAGTLYSDVALFSTIRQ